MQKSPLSDLDAVMVEARRQRAEVLHQMALSAIDALARLFRRSAPSRSH